MTRGIDPRAIDLPALCRLGEIAEGHFALADLHRLAQSLMSAPDAGAGVAWRAACSLLPRAGGEPQHNVDLQAQANVTLACQRCLQPMDETLVVGRRLLFVHGEDEAARLDEDSDDDVLALPPRLDVQALVEDELILALPLVPRHAVCPLPLPAPQPAEAERAHPFAALAALRKGQPS